MDISDSLLEHLDLGRSVIGKPLQDSQVACVAHPSLYPLELTTFWRSFRTLVI